MKIGFLAMSGIRAHDPVLLELGLTLPGFVERSRQVAALPSLGLLLLAARTPPGHELLYRESDAGPRALEDLAECDLVAIGTFSAQAFEAYEAADELRRRGVPVAIGGLHASALPEEALEHADFVVVGEGENVWPELVASVERGDAHAGTIVDADLAPAVDVDRLPVPRYDLLGARPYDRFPVQTTRGCPWRCEFCASTVLLGRPYRKRPVDQVVRDVRAILARSPGAFLELADDNTFVDKDWGRDLCEALAPLGVRWFTETDVTVADDPGLLERMAASGCRQVLVGLESPDGDDLHGMELNADFKERHADRYADAVRAIQSHGITVNGCFVLGLDTHGPEIFGEVLRFSEEVGLYEVQVTLQTAFPGTPLLERLSAEGRVLEPGRWDLCTLFDVNYRPRHMTPQQLREGLYWLSERLYSREGIRRRRERFFAQRRAHAWPRSIAPARAPRSRRRTRA